MNLTMNVNNQIRDSRSEYKLNELSENDVPDNPLLLVQDWLQQATQFGIRDANATVVSTVDDFMTPTSRIVLVREITDSSLVFFSNYASAKGGHVDKRPKTSCLFYWRELERQIRLEGTLEKSTHAVSQEYFSTRPRSSQIGAWASPQSQIISGRETLEKMFQEAERKFDGVSVIPCPPFWGGFVFTPSKIEFWQGRESRLHDRVVSTKGANNTWTKSRLAP
jgi:pyridoxamine 5'-phosphate oxidase